MKLSITSRAEIRELLLLLVELQGLHKSDFAAEHIFESFQGDDETIDTEAFQEDYPYLAPVFKDACNMTEVVEGIARIVHEMPFERILWNCDALLVNCADLREGIDTLDFSRRIHLAFAGIDLLQRMHDFMSEDPRNSIGQGAQMYTELEAILEAYTAATPQEEQA